MTLYMLEWVEGNYDDVSITLCGIFTSAEKRAAEKQRLTEARNGKGRPAFDPNYREGEWQEADIEADANLVTDSQIEFMGDTHGY